MPRRRKGRKINGIVLVNKPIGGSSNNILQKVRWLYQAEKAGHTGALDPLASGMLPICLGEATKFSQFLLDADKTYRVTAKLGVRTTTSDADGEVVEEKPVGSCEQEVIDTCLSFIGKSKQIPSMFSALKHEGKPLYWYARQGITIDRKPRDINIFSLTIDQISLPEVTMTVHCSKGTYIRSLVDDIGQALGCGAYVTMLHRTRVADYPAERMIALDDLVTLAGHAHEQQDFAALDSLLLPMDMAVMSLNTIQLNDEQVDRFEHGQSILPLSTSVDEGQLYRIYRQQPTTFLGVGEAIRNPKDQPEQVRGQGLFVMPRRRVVY
ncbi:tRNA pseudouridine(55) synthase TruB [Alteromonas sp. ASW11-130]|uniref:tRNA pseudouridine(55) synthase TruB n=1 Tax=Alteromonas sp. ASW11-130 TaxID=3015775 RepID=UPI002242652F|nr:tRNA pseudouridine(55) synthase TruB [Alteromonas sp. ASW11-130]MCW8090242.1 tRNA pseudouridine(55) synthase TruB [Alteromonas sp. ASW11-130]